MQYKRLIDWSNTQTHKWKYRDTQIQPCQKYPTPISWSASSNSAKFIVWTNIVNNNWFSSQLSVEYFDSSNSSGSQIISNRWKWKFWHNLTLIPSSEVCQLSLIRCHFFQLFLVCQISVKIMPYFNYFLPKCNCAKFHWYIAIFH